MIYVIEALNGVECLAVKIGFTRDSAERRLKELQSASPLELKLVCTTPDSRFVEHYIHHHLIVRGHRLRGEWYRPSQEVVFFIYDLKTTHKPFLALERMLGVHQREHAANACRWKRSVALIQFQQLTRTRTALDAFSREVRETSNQLSKFAAVR